MIIVVGSGAAGIATALAACEQDRVLLLTKDGVGDSNTDKAQGGIAASVLPGDSPAAHARDTIAVGVGLNDRHAVEVLTRGARGAIDWLLRLGARFDRDPDGTLAHGLEAAHSFPRVLHGGGDATGHVIEQALLKALRASAVETLDHTLLLDLIVDEDGRGRRATGVRAARHGHPVELRADAVVLACGGIGQLYGATTNPAGATGDGAAAAWRAGAAICDPEFVQFHPTVLAVPEHFLVSEAVRGAGAVLRDDAGRRFMVGRHPLAELAPRDVVAREIGRVMAQQGGHPVRLDATVIEVRGADPAAARAAFFARRFPTIDAACRAHGFDWAREPIPVTPAAHYWMGGVRTDAHGRTSLPGLYAAGEVASTGVHGANRLASNSLLEALVFGRRAGEAAAGDARGSRGDAVWPRFAASGVDGSAWASSTAEPPPAGGAEHLRARVQHAAWGGIGLVRDARGIEAAGRELATLADAAARRVARTLAAGADRGDSPEEAAGTDQRALQRAVETADMAQLGALIARAAATRRESRGAHTRSDYPRTDPAQAHSRLFVLARPRPLAVAPAASPASAAAPGGAGAA